MKIAPAQPSDAADWTKMRSALWPQASAKEHFAEIDGLLADPGNTLNLIARGPDGKALGFAEASLRYDHVNGCETSPVAFLEGIYVEPQARERGIARRLVEDVEGWAQSQGCSELGSDAALGNLDSHAMHAALGFQETERVVYFRKVLHRAVR